MIENTDQDENQGEIQDKLLDTISASLEKKRKKAIAARQNSGIEKEWREDRLYYSGKDSESQSFLMSRSIDGPLIETTNNNSNNKSTAFINITQPYVDMVTSKIIDVINSDRPFRADPTPVPDIDELRENDSPMENGGPTIGEVAQEYLAEIGKKAKKAEDKIWDWLVESRFDTTLRKAITDCCMIGTGVIKGPVPLSSKRTVVTHENGMATIKQVMEINPTSRHIKPEDFYPDGSCGEDIKDAAYFFERDRLSWSVLKDLMDQPGYISGQIEKCLKEGPDQDKEDGNVDDDDQYTIWNFTGKIEADLFGQARCSCNGYDSDDENEYAKEKVDIIASIVNGKIVRLAPDPMAGECSYDVIQYKKRPGCWQGVGVARQVRPAQDMIIAAVRNMLDNAGIAGGPQICINTSMIRPLNGVYELTGRKFWESTVSDENFDIRRAIQIMSIPIVQKDLADLIALALKFAEQTTSLPLLLQGQQGSATDTKGGMEILNNNSSSTFRAFVKEIDDSIIGPHIDKYYKWILQYHEDDSLKGDLKINPTGASVLFERAEQSQMLIALMQMAGDPELEISKEKLIDEILKAYHFRPEMIKLDADEKQRREEMQQEQGQPVDPKLQIAQLRAQVDMEKTKLVQQSDMAEIQAKTQSSNNDLQLKLEMQVRAQEHELRLEQMKYDMKMMELAQQQQISLDSIKASLAKEALGVRTQKELFYNGKGKSPEVVAPKFEPVGRAPDGESYQK